MRQTAAVVALAALLAVVVAAPSTPTGTSAGPSLRIVLRNAGYATLAVGADGAAYGKSTASGDPTHPYRLYRSSNRGRTWARMFDFPANSNIRFITALTDGTLIAHVDLGNAQLWRSADRGRTFSKVFEFPPGYRTLSAHSVTDDGRYVYFATYANLDAGSHPNTVWRSANDGRTWSVVHRSTNHRHAHFAQVDPYTGDLYVGYGDQGSQVAIERSSDAGVTWRVVCASDACTAVDLAFDPSGYALFGQDHVWSPASIMRLDLASGRLTEVAPLPGPSYSAINLGAGRWLVGETHEPQGSVFDPADLDVHLLGSNDGGATFRDVLALPFKDPAGYVRMMVQYTYADGSFPILALGYGTLVGRLDGGAAPLGVLDLTTRVTGSVVRVSAPLPSCDACRASLRLRVRSAWRSAPMLRSGARVAGVLRNVPRGRWLVYVAVTGATGESGSSPLRSVAVS